MAADLWMKLLQGNNQQAQIMISIGGRNQKGPLDLAKGLKEKASGHLAPGHFFARFVEEAPELTDEAKRTRARELARQLGSEDPGERDEATRALAAMGAEITRVLAPLLGLRDPEVRARVRAILDPWSRKHSMEKFRRGKR